MSWSEIKKAVNSNLDVPLNEKLEKMFLYDNFVAKSFTYGQTAFETLIDVDGGGELQYIEIRTSGYITTTKVTIDDKEYLFQNISSSARLCSQKYAMAFCGASTTGGIPTVVTRNGSVSNVGAIPFSSISRVSESPTTIYQDAYISFENEFKFNHKLKVEVRVDTSGHNSVWGIGYELYD